MLFVPIKRVNWVKQKCYLQLNRLSCVLHSLPHQSSLFIVVSVPRKVSESVSVHSVASPTMQCTCPNAYHANTTKSYTLKNNRRVNPNNRFGDISRNQSSVQWYSSQTLPNPKRSHHIRGDTAATNECPCRSTSCVFSSSNSNRSHPYYHQQQQRSDPRRENPVKSCLNISTIVPPQSHPLNPPPSCTFASSATSLPSASRGDCYLCSRSQQQPPQRICSISQQQQKLRKGQSCSDDNEGNRPPLRGPYLVSDFVTSHLPNNNNLEHQLRYSSGGGSNKSLNNCQQAAADNVIPWRCCFDSNCDPRAVGHKPWPSSHSLTNFCSLHRQNSSRSNKSTLVNIFSYATQYQEDAALHHQQPLLFDDSLCQPNYLQRRGAKMTAGSCLSGGNINNNNNNINNEDDEGSPPSSPPLNIPPPPLPPLSRAPSLGGSIGRGGDRSMHNGGVSNSGGCAKCRFAILATPTHNRHSNNQSNGGVCGSNYSHFGYHHQHLKQQQQGMGTGSHHYGSNNSYSGEWRKRRKSDGEEAE